MKEPKDGTVLTFLGSDTVGGLSTTARRLRDRLAGHPGAWRVAADSPGVGKTRLAVIAESTDDMTAKLDAAIARLDGGGARKLPEGLFLSGATPRDAGKVA